MHEASLPVQTCVGWARHWDPRLLLVVVQRLLSRPRFHCTEIFHPISALSVNVCFGKTIPTARGAPGARAVLTRARAAAAATRVAAVAREPAAPPELAGSPAAAAHVPEERAGPGVQRVESPDRIPRVEVPRAALVRASGAPPEAPARRDPAALAQAAPWPAAGLRAADRAVPARVERPAHSLSASRAVAPARRRGTPKPGRGDCSCCSDSYSPR
jgi:hypothetical protein